MIKIVVLCMGLILNVSYLSQSQMVFNNGGFVVIENNGVVVLENSNSNAITQLNGSGNIISEGENNQVKWNVNNQIGIYSIPFTTNSLVSIPLSIDIQSPGSIVGSINFSSYETATDNNSLYPSLVLDMNGTCNGDNSLSAVDRFWKIDASSYTVKPDVDISFGYDDAANEIGGTNIIAESNLQAQRFNTLTGTWEAPSKLFGISNPTSNKVENALVSGTDLYTFWTLIDTTSFTVYDTLTTSICQGDSILFNQGYLFNSGTYSYLNHSPLVCDTIFTLVLSINPIYLSSLTDSICFGDSLSFGGVFYNSSGLYYDSLTSINGCDSITTMSLSVLDESQSEVNHIICEGDSILIEGIYYSADTLLIEIYSNSLGCDSIATTNLTILNTTVQNLDTLLCEGSQINFGNQLISNAGIYYDSLQGMLGCDSIVELMVNYQLLPNVIVTAEDDLIISGETTNLNVTGGVSYVWSPLNYIDCETCNTVEVNPTENTTFYVLVTDGPCQVIDSIEVLVNQIEVKIPYGFSPNDDGISDLWIIEGLEYYPKNELTILNRWGNEILKQTPYQNDWDGTYNSQPLPTGTYFFILKLDADSDVEKGYIYINK